MLNNLKNSLNIEITVQECIDRSNRPQISFEDYIAMIEFVEAQNESIQNNTRLMFTKFRKVYYDSFGWNDELIRGTEKVKPFKSVPKDLNNQQHIIKMKNGDLYDIAHIFAIVDAANHNGYFTPLPDFLMPLHKLFPTVDSRLTASGWLGDLSSVTGQFFLKWKTEKKILSDAEKQAVVDTYSPCDKMISNADALVIINHYAVSSSNGKKVSEILRDYYEEGGKGDALRPNRYSLFARYLDLNNWDNKGFENEERWLSYYHKQLKTCSSFYLIFFRKKLSTIIWSFLIWMGLYKKELEANNVLIAFLEGLKRGVQSEQL